MIRILLFACALPTYLLAQRPDEPPAVIDTIVIEVANVFRDEEAGAPVKRFMNAIHVPTKRHVILNELLLRPGDPYDSVLAALSERNLRALGLFSTINIDTSRIEGDLALQVTAQDGVSLQPTISFQVIGSTFLWTLGAQESNLAGTGSMVRAQYRQEADRNGLDAGARFAHVAGSQIDIDGGFERWSDGNVGFALVGDPYRSDLDRQSVVLFSGAADRQVLQYRTETNVDTTAFRQTGFLGRVDYSRAPVAQAIRFLRVGLQAQIRREEFTLVQDTGLAVPDTLTGAIGLFAEYQASGFRVIAPQFNGLGSEEDLDISRRARLDVWVAPGVFGYERGGVGSELELAAGLGGDRGFVKLELAANGLFTGTGLDSGRVDVDATLGLHPARRHWDLLHIAVGAQHNPPPGGEYDLGAGSASAASGCGNATLCAAAGAFTPPRAFLGPRLFGPHSFTGTRTVWATYEHRWFVIDDVAGWFGIGVAGFFDYGAAWYADQDPRGGGNVGVGLRIGGIRGTGASLVRVDVGYLFGGGVTDSVVVGIGKAFVY